MNFWYVSTESLFSPKLLANWQLGGQFHPHPPASLKSRHRVRESLSPELVPLCSRSSASDKPHKLVYLDQEPEL
jgi:hypothetical protein